MSRLLCHFLLELTVEGSTCNISLVCSEERHEIARKQAGLCEPAVREIGAPESKTCCATLLRERLPLKDVSLCSCSGIMSEAVFVPTTGCFTHRSQRGEELPQKSC